MPAQEKNIPSDSGAVKLTKSKAKLKRPIAEKDGASSISQADNKPLEGALSPGSTSKVNNTEWFTTEIQGMMYGFGDCQTPMLESAQLIEEIVHQQMNSLLMQAAEVAVIRGVKFVGPEDMLFLLRKDKAKLARLIKYMEVKDLKTSFSKASNAEEDDPVEHCESKQAVTRSKRIKMCQEFISSIDQTGELMSLFDTEIFDETKHQREVRLEQRTRCMDQAQYLIFSEARQMSFNRKYRSNKFRDWLLKDNLTELKPTALALEIFNYMAYETVAQIVDLSLLVKKDSSIDSDDPISRLTFPGAINPGFPIVQLAGASRCTGGLFRPDSPAQSPASPPLSPNGSFNVGNAMLNKLKAKKRRKSENKQPYDPLSGCIEPCDIREALTRFFKDTGPISLFSKSHNNNLYTRLMCC